MEMRLEKRDSFTITGYLIETLPTDDGYDTKCIALRDKHEAALRKNNAILYGATWFTETENLYYLFGAQQEMHGDAGISNVDIPAGLFAVATVPADMPLIQAWNEMWATGLPSIGYTYIEGEKCFELFGENGVREIWVPAQK